MQPTEAVGAPVAQDGFAPVILDGLDRFHALVVGPGLGRSDATVDGVRRLVHDAAVPVLVDGDGLFAVHEQLGCVRDRTAPTVLTPHDGEYAVLAGSPPGDDRIGAARRLARDLGAVVLLKGPATVVASPAGEALVVSAGDERLATAGTGDVLSGIIGVVPGPGRGAVRRRGPRRVGPRLGRPSWARPGASWPATSPTSSPRSWRAPVTATERWAWAEVDLAAVRHNVRWLRAVAAPAAVWAVVKANGYGHGAVPVARRRAGRGSGRVVRGAGQRGDRAPRRRHRRAPPGAVGAAAGFDARGRLTRVADDALHPGRHRRRGGRGRAPAVRRSPST